MIRNLSLSTHFLPPFLIPHPKPRKQMTTGEMSSKQVKEAVPSCHRPPDPWEENVAGERHWTRVAAQTAALPDAAAHLHRAEQQQEEAEGWAARAHAAAATDCARRTD